MADPKFRFNKIKYSRKNSEDLLFVDLMKKRDAYFLDRTKHGTPFLIVKALVLLSICAFSYLLIFKAQDYLLLQLAYIIFGTSLVMLGINFGHDAAHNCLTGNKRVDNAIFEMIFGLQGINGYLWKIRHNHSHHPFPNVYDYDSDLEITNLIYLNPTQRKRRIHYYQHLYAPILYMFITLFWIFYVDFKVFNKTELANMVSIKHRRVEWVKLLLYKIASIVFYLILPLLFAALSPFLVLSAFIIMHLLISLILTFVFFVSHHVSETAYSTVHDGGLGNSWTEQQVSSTLDFHAESKVANFIFGGFNAHLAHHIFPDVSHVHYPVLTRLIKQSLKDHHLKYNSLSLVKAVRSHLVLLKNLPHTIPSLE
jgi:linoleoyl-CoA desaturase